MSEILPSTCPHDCPSACALKVERIDERTIGRIHGDEANPFTAGVICAKVARYAERVHHPERLTTPLRRTGRKGEGRFEHVSWDEALDEIADRFTAIAARHGPEAIWPYFYAGTMGQIQRGATNRLRNLMGYSGQAGTICTAIGYSGWRAGVGKMIGTHPLEMAESDLIVLWGCNAAATQVNTLTHVARARRERGATVVVVDPYRTPTAEKADLHLAPRPGSDGALACAVAHWLFANGHADHDYLDRYTDDPQGFRTHLADKTPAWAASVTGLSEAEIIRFAELYASTRRSFIRIGLGMSRQRNGAVNVHAVSCLPAITGAWQVRGGGALMATSDCFHLDRTLIEANDLGRPGRELDMCRIGPVLTGDRQDLGEGPPVLAMLIQNTNPADVAPESARVRAGLAREDLFLVVHEQFMTDTARYADLVLPATSFLEHDDFYTSYGHTFLQPGMKLIEPPGEARSNHSFINELLLRLGADHASCRMDERTLMDATLLASGYPGVDELLARGRLDCSLPSEQMRFLDGFPQPDGRFHFRPRWPRPGMPEWPDHWAANEPTSEAYPYRLITPPARHFLNSGFSMTPGSRLKEQRPTLLIHPQDALKSNIEDGRLVKVFNQRGEVSLTARVTDAVSPGLLVAEGIWPGRDFPEGVGVNALVGADLPGPVGGAAFHDIAVNVASTD